MLKWIDVIKFANNGTPPPDRRVEKTEEEWKSILAPEVFRITRQKGTEAAHSSEMCSRFEPGAYTCVCCGTLLFDADQKFESGTGWPSFTQPVKDNVIAYIKDMAYGMYRIETTCNTCDAHLGHVFQDGPMPSGLRYCMNALALQKVENPLKKATFGGGCFWCTEAMFQQLDGVELVMSGYSGGRNSNPTYREVCSEATGHAEVIEVTYNPEKISFRDLVSIHMLSHDPTTLNQQGADRGTQYRSIVFYRDEEEQKTASEVIKETEEALGKAVTTQVEKLEVFYPAEDYHQDYYNNNGSQGYCRVVIEPKLEKFRKLFSGKLKKA